MSDILESTAVITVKKTFNQFAKFYGFEVLPKMLQVVYQSDLNKLCQSNINSFGAIGDYSRSLVDCYCRLWST